MLFRSGSSFERDVRFDQSLRIMKTQVVSALGKLIVGLLLAGFTAASAEAQTAKKILVVTVTKGFRHSSIPTATRFTAKTSSIRTFKCSGASFELITRKSASNVWCRTSNIRQPNISENHSAWNARKFI